MISFVTSTVQLKLRNIFIEIPFFVSATYRILRSSLYGPAFEGQITASLAV
jgi:hypothetical protein